MPALTNHRQERFCQLIKQGIPPFKAYPLAGYRPNNGSPYRLQENARVRRRLVEITKGLAMKTKVSVESITEQLNEIRERALAVDQHGAAHAAVVSTAKLHGLMIERKEAGAPGDFAGVQSAEELLQLAKTELGDEVAAVLAAIYARKQAEPAATAAPDASPDLPPGPGRRNETLN